MSLINKGSHDTITFKEEVDRYVIFTCFQNLGGNGSFSVVSRDFLIKYCAIVISIKSLGYSWFQYSVCYMFRAVTITLPTLGKLISN